MVNKAGLAAALCILAAQGARAQNTPKVVQVHMETSAAADGGTVWLQQEKKDVKVVIKLKNLDPGNHGIHLPQNAHCDAPPFMTAGGHFNPGGKQHGTQNPQGHHAGDFAMNLAVNDGGSVDTSFTTKDLTLDPKAPNSVFANGGTAIIVHQNADDMKTDPSGNAGMREACGVVSMANVRDSISETPGQSHRADEGSSNH